MQRTIIKNYTRLTVQLLKQRGIW